MASKLEISDVTKDYAIPGGQRTVRALEQVSFAVHGGEFVSLLGPSGCGKSTLLTMIAGFERASAGQIRLDGQVVEGPGADRGLVFQDYALFPWKTLLDNVMYGPSKRGLPRRQCKEIAQRYIALVGLSGFESHYPINCRAACASAARSPGRWRTIPRSCSWTSRLRRSMR